jgi:hypothetical protein
MKKVLLVFILLSTQILNAQESFNSAGNHAIGNNGFVEYSFGQVFVDISGDLNTSQTGVQQVYNPNIVTLTREIEASSIQVLPNPAIEEVNISHLQNGKIKTIEIFNAAGMLIEMIEVNEKQISINIKHIANGLYFFRVITQEGNQHTTRVVKKA